MHLSNVSEPTCLYTNQPTATKHRRGRARLSRWQLPNPWPTISRATESLHSVELHRRYLRSGEVRRALPRSLSRQPADLEDAQQAMRHHSRSHAAGWSIDPTRIGAPGFSAGRHLACLLRRPRATTPTTSAPAMSSTRSMRSPDFVVVTCYPGYLYGCASSPASLSVGIDPSPRTPPPTFLLQAEDDPVHEGERASYTFRRLKRGKGSRRTSPLRAGRPRLTALRPTDLPVTHWPATCRDLAPHHPRPHWPSRRIR